MSKTEDTQTELPKAYEAKNIEEKWYGFWEQNKLFSAQCNSNKKPYCISIPPPNVTGVLHMGHALGDTLQDVLIRWKRMLGFEALWVPGTDHAGIATQTVVERHLMKTKGKTRKEFSREDFLDEVWKWKENSETRIINQIKRLGCSCDWDRLRFTMDDGCNKAVRTVFKKMFDEGLIYRANYLVNWDPVTKTALADDEVEYEDRHGSLWHIKYPLADGSGFIRIATTRPETMLGDTAIAVSPRDERYTHLIGKNVILPLANRSIPIIADHYVDPEFGTGMVKVTPAHDPNDYQIGLRHNLPQINILTPDAHINEQGLQFEGLTIEEARKAVVEALDGLNLVEAIEPHLHRVGVSYRSKAVIQPYLSLQWFVKMDKFGRSLRAMVDDGNVKILPQNWESTYFHWIDNLRDWCISRQLWWGHRIPVWYNKMDPDRILCWGGEGEPPEVTNAPNEWVQEDDVLDTWFSAALWPLSTLGWPDDTPELKTFYPNAILITGHDILFFWVARMLLMGKYLKNEAPFPETFLHGLIFGKSYWRKNQQGGINYVTDKERVDYDLGKTIPPDVSYRWEKMSKTKGNIIDPLEIIDLYGADAMRMALCASVTQAREIDLDRRRFEDFKNFANKVWNGARFTMMNLEGRPEDGLNALTAQDFANGLDSKHLDLEDHWILSKLQRTVRDVNRHLTAYSFDQAASQAYDFFWKEFCSYFLEIAKPVLTGKRGSPEKRANKQKLLVIVMCQAIRLLHPMAPFITEELFQRLKERFPNLKADFAADVYTQETIKALSCPACIVAHYPEVINTDDIKPEIESAFDVVSQAVYTIRNLRGEMQLPPSIAVDVYINSTENAKELMQLQKNQGILEALVKVNRVHFDERIPQAFGAKGTVSAMTVFIPLPEGYKKQEKVRLEKEKGRLETSLAGLRQRLNNKDFVEKAPSNLVDDLRKQVADAETALDHLSSALAQLD
ncbi:MAG: valine--tRNA ligase [Parachlamydiales bacterium]|jgi:valyl-tRNA synthetase